MNEPLIENATILVADDHPLFRDALASALGGLPEPRNIEMVGSFDEALEILGARNNIEIVLLDLNMPGSKGLSGLSRIKSQFPEIPVVIVSATEDNSSIRRSIVLGASGYIPKSTSTVEIRDAIMQVLDGDLYVPDHIDLDADVIDEENEIAAKLQSLTPQQARVLDMLGEGLLNKQIAYELSVSEATVKAHVSAILLKLNVDSRTQAVILLNSFVTNPGDGDNQLANN